MSTGMKNKQKEPEYNILGVAKSESVGTDLCKMPMCKPSTKKEDLPGRSYKTSTKIGHPRIHPFFNEQEKLKFEVPPDSVQRQYLPKNLTYRSSYKTAFTKKCDCYGANDKLNAPHSLRYKMIFNWAEKLRSAPVRKSHEVSSEMKDKYRLHLPDETLECGGILNDMKPYTICNIHSVSKDTQTKTDARVHCVQKVLDPYISTQQYDYISYSENDIAKYRHTKAEPVQLITPRKTPVYDESFLRLKFMDRFLRKKPPTVPHSGLTTEVRDNYKLPLNELAHKKQLYCSSIFRTALTKGEVMATPAMYHTDYDHYGRNWPLSTIL